MESKQAPKRTGGLTLSEEQLNRVHEDEALATQQRRTSPFAPGIGTPKTTSLQSQRTNYLPEGSAFVKAMPAFQGRPEDVVPNNSFEITTATPAAPHPYLSPQQGGIATPLLTQREQLYSVMTAAKRMGPEETTTPSRVRVNQTPLPTFGVPKEQTIQSPSLNPEVRPPSRAVPTEGVVRPYVPPLAQSAADILATLQRMHVVNTSCHEDHHRAMTNFQGEMLKLLARQTTRDATTSTSSACQDAEDNETTVAFLGPSTRGRPGASFSSLLRAAILFVVRTFAKLVAAIALRNASYQRCHIPRVH